MGKIYSPSDALRHVPAACGVPEKPEREPVANSVFYLADARTLEPKICVICVICGYLIFLGDPFGMLGGFLKQMAPMIQAFFDLAFEADFAGLIVAAAFG